MAGKEFLAQRFEEKRAHLRAVAFRMLGSSAEAEDAVQEAWLRLDRSDASEVDNLGGWLTTVVARICLDMLRSRKARAEDDLDAAPEPVAPATDADRTALLDSIGTAMLVVLGTLAPAERVSFVLHDMFDLSFDEIAPIVGKTPVATRKLASRARHRVRGTSETNETERARKQELVDAFLVAARGGDLQGLLRVLDPDVVFRADPTATKLGGNDWGEQRGAAAIAQRFLGRAAAARPAMLDGEIGFSIEPNGVRKLVVALTFRGDRISHIEAIADAASLEELAITSL